MAEAKSKGRGEECISQNLRILRGHNGKRVMLFFANSQRGALKRYVSVPREFSLFFSAIMPTLHNRLASLFWHTSTSKHLRWPHHPLAILIFHFPLLSEHLSKTSHSQLRGERETTQESRATRYRRAQSKL